MILLVAIVAISATKLGPEQICDRERAGLPVFHPAFIIQIHKRVSENKPDKTEKTIGRTANKQVNRHSGQ